MFSYNKFFNIDAPEQPATPSLASLMASQGVFNNTENPVANPVSIPETKEEPPTATEPQQTATVSEVQAETAIQESLPPTEPSPQAPPPIEEKPEAVVPTWQEVLKQQQPDTIFKELGVDGQAVELARRITPEMKAFFEHWQANGDVTAYLRELTTDYTKMPAEEVMRNQLRREYPKASEAALNVLYEEEVIERYKLDPERYSEEEIQRGRLLLEAKADRYRDELVAGQKNFLLPPPPEKPDPVEPSDNTEQLRQYEGFKNLVSNDAYTKNVFTHKVLAIGEGEDRYNHPVQNPQALTDLLFDDKKFGEKLFHVQQTPEGVKLIPNVQKQLLVAAILEDEKGFLNGLSAHYRTLGEKAAIASLENAKLPDSSTPSKPEIPADNAAGAMARYGRLVG